MSSEILSSLEEIRDNKKMSEEEKKEVYVSLLKHFDENEKREEFNILYNFYNGFSQDLIQTFFEKAVKESNKLFIRQLYRTCNATINEDIYELAIEIGNIQVLRYLIEQEPLAMPENALMLTTNIDVIMLLSQNGANLNNVLENINEEASIISKFNKMLNIWSVKPYSTAEIKLFLKCISIYCSHTIGANNRERSSDKSLNALMTMHDIISSTMVKEDFSSRKLVTAQLDIIILERNISDLTVLKKFMESVL